MLSAASNIRSKAGRAIVRATLLFAVALSIVTAAPALAAPPDPALRQQLLALFQEYGKDVKAGDLSGAATLRTAKVRAELLAELKKSPKDVADDLDFMREAVPDSIVIVHANQNAQGVTIETVAAKKMPTGVPLGNGLKPGQVVHSELTLSFQTEGGVWKLADDTFGADPASIKPCHDDERERISTYKDDTGSVGGRIERVDFKADHTLVVVRIVDEDDCLILPPRPWLAVHDANLAKLVPWSTIEADTHSHPTDKRRFWATHWTETAE